MEKPKDIDLVAKKPTKGRVQLLYALPYMGCMVYLMRMDGDLFNSFTVIDGQLHHFYLEISTEKGSNKHTKDEINKVIQILLAGAHTSIEQAKGKADERSMAIAEEVSKVGAKVFGEPKEDKVIN
jgi:hypothetical protein